MQSYNNFIETAKNIEGNSKIQHYTYATKPPLHKKASRKGMLFSVYGGYYAVRIDFYKASSGGELILVSDLSVREIKIVGRDSVSLHYFFSKLTV